MFDLLDLRRDLSMIYPPGVAVVLVGRWRNNGTGEKNIRRRAAPAATTRDSAAAGSRTA